MYFVTVYIVWYISFLKGTVIALGNFLWVVSSAASLSLLFFTGTNSVARVFLSFRKHHYTITLQSIESSLWACWSEIQLMICTLKRDSQDFPAPSWFANIFKSLTISILIARDWCLCTWYDFCNHDNIFLHFHFPQFCCIISSVCLLDIMWKGMDFRLEVSAVY